MEWTFQHFNFSSHKLEAREANRGRKHGSCQWLLTDFSQPKANCLCTEALPRAERSSGVHWKSPPPHRSPVKVNTVFCRQISEDMYMSVLFLLRPPFIPKCQPQTKPTASSMLSPEDYWSHRTVLNSYKVGGRIVTLQRRELGSREQSSILPSPRPSSPTLCVKTLGKDETCVLMHKPQSSTSEKLTAVWTWAIIPPIRS